MKRISTIITCVVTLIFFCQLAKAQEIDYKGFPEWSWHKTGNTEYYLYTPKNMIAGKKYPVALFLHGCCGVNDHATLRNCVDAPVRMWHNFGENTQCIPTYIIAPATSHGWAQHIPDLKRVMDSLIEKQNADPKRVYLCGFSMGADGTFTFINQYPDYFAAVMTLGMKFHGDSLKVKNLPLWISQGETDYFSRPVRRQVKNIRHLNGYYADTGSTWSTGVNPLYSNFKGFGHVVLWEAASRQDMVGWAYSKVNDGNKYPNVFFNSPNYEATVLAGKPLKLDISANDPDGHIVKVDIFVNHKLAGSLNKAPYITSITPARGRNYIEAVAVDNGGKARAATLVVKTIIPLKLLINNLPPAIAGSYYKIKLPAEGYGQLHFKATKGDLPGGMELNQCGVLCGVVSEKGLHTVKFILGDSTGIINVKLKLNVKPKSTGEVLVTNAATTNGTRYRIAKLVKGETPDFNSKDTIPPIWKEEVNFSNLDKYEGLTYIKTDVNDTSKTEKDFLSFDVDENVMVYVAYEALDLKYHSTVPSWLDDFKKQDGQIVAQFKYYDVYAKKYLKGTIVLPGADARRNKVGSNYFVIVKKE